jgi:hypothetical protein
MLDSYRFTKCLRIKTDLNEFNRKYYRGTEMSFQKTPPGLSRGHLPISVTATAMGANDTAWSLLYGALINELGVSPQQFQLLYPPTSWNWPTNNPGFISAAQYDFCATIPQWSATGAYVSSGATFDNAYQQFLNTIVLNASTPQLQQQIVAAQNNLTQASSNLQTTVSQALATYNSTVVNNLPTYTDWLASPAGIGYGSQINALTKQVTQAQNVVNQLAMEQTTPNIANALNAFNNPQVTGGANPYYSKLVDTSLTGFPPVPQWAVSSSSAQWVSQVQGGGGSGGSITFSNSQAAYDYSKTWAQASGSVGNWFYSVYANGSWQQSTEFQSDSSLSVTITFKAWDTIAITPSKWYSGTTAFRNGPFARGYTATSQPESMAYMFGKGGMIPLLKTGMLVCYQPTISISCSTSTYQSFQKQWSAAGGIQIGPFQIGGSAGGSSMNWSSSSTGMTLTVESTSTTPLIFGINIAVEPM